MIEKTVDYWVVGFDLPKIEDVYDAIDAARREKAIVRLHWHTPAYPYYGPSSDMAIEVLADDDAQEVFNQIPTNYAV